MDMDNVVLGGAGTAPYAPGCGEMVQPATRLRDNLHVDCVAHVA